MVVEEQVKERLKEVLVPGAMRNFYMLNLIRGIAVSDGSIKVTTLASAAINTIVQNWITISKRNLANAARCEYVYYKIVLWGPVKMGKNQS